jgi:CBS domain containing-hemolysin-like protein
MTWLWAVVVVLVVLGSVLAMAEASISRMNRVRALSLREEDRRNADKLVQIEEQPARFLNAIYLWVMLVQNGSAIMVAILAEQTFGGIGVVLLSVAFTLAYFVSVEAMSKTFGILRSDRVALALAPVVVVLARILSLPTRGLIGLANVLLPGKGLKTGPFVSEEDIRTMASVGHEEGAIEEEEKEMIHSIFEFGDTVVREVMVPRPDMIGVDIDASLDDGLKVMQKHGFSRLPVWEDGDPNKIQGLVYMKDVVRKLHGARNGRNGKRARPSLKDLVRKAMFVPESKKVSELLREMQAKKTHMAIVVDEYGDTDGLVTLEDLLEEIVGEIEDEYDRREPAIEQVDELSFRVKGSLPIGELSEVLDIDLPNTEWDTVGGMIAGLLGHLPKQGEAVEFQGLRFKTERVQGRRIAKVMVTKPATGRAAAQ